MNRIESYPKLTIDIVKWIKDYYFYNNIDTLVVGVSGGIDSAVVSTLCAETGLPTYVVTMPLDSKKEILNYQIYMLKNLMKNMKMLKF